MLSRHSSKLLISLLVIAIPFATIEIARAVGVITTDFLPAPSQVFMHLRELCLDHADFQSDLKASAWRYLAGVLIASPAAIALAVAAEMYWAFGSIVRPWVAMTYPIPKLAIFPFLLLIFGIGDASKIAIVALGVFYFVFMYTVVGLQYLRNEGYFDIAKVYRIPGPVFLRKILLRGALPYILEGVKVGSSYGLVMIVAGEFTAARNGLGIFIWNAWDQYRILDLYAGITLISILGLAIFGSLDWVIERLHK